MKELIIYFGKQKDSVLGFGSTSDTIRVGVDDDFTPHKFTSTKWQAFKLPDGIRTINTDNVLWFDLIDKVDKED